MGCADLNCEHVWKKGFSIGCVSKALEDQALGSPWVEIRQRS